MKPAEQLAPFSCQNENAPDSLNNDGAIISLLPLSNLSLVETICARHIWQLKRGLGYQRPLNEEKIFICIYTESFFDKHDCTLFLFLMLSIFFYLIHLMIKDLCRTTKYTHPVSFGNYIYFSVFFFFSALNENV